MLESAVDLVRRLFGLPQVPSHGRPFIDERHVQVDEDETSSSSLSVPDRPFDHFEVWSHPLEMHRFFQQQMDEMMRNFGVFGKQNNLDSFGHNDMFNQFFHSNPFEERRPTHAEAHSRDGGGNGERDFMLRSDGSPDPKFYDHAKGDRDLDNELRDKDLQQLAPQLFGEDRGSYGQQHEQHERSSWMPHNFSYGESVSEEVTRHADGSVERRTTRTSSNGLNETTVTITGPDGRSRVITSHGGSRDPEESRVDVLRPRVDLDKDRQSIFDSFFGGRRQ